MKDASAESFGSQPSQGVGHLDAGVGFQWYSYKMDDGLTDHSTAHSTSIYTFTEVNSLPRGVRRQEYPLLSNKSSQMIIHKNP